MPAGLSAVGVVPWFPVKVAGVVVPVVVVSGFSEPTRGIMPLSGFVVSGGMTNGFDGSVLKDFLVPSVIAVLPASATTRLSGDFGAVAIFLLSCSCNFAIS